MVGCAFTPARDFSKIKIGMSRGEVIAVKGKPFETAAKDGTEYLFYQEPYELKEYFVRLVDGKVDSYGRVGDFDSTKDPTLRIIKQRK